MQKTLTTTAMLCTFALAVGISAQGTGKETAKPAQEKQAQSKQATAADDKGSPDASWMREVAMDGMAEVEHGRTASKNGEDAEVRKFGERMVADHSKANDELKGLASKKNVTLPTDMGPKHRAMQEKLEKMKGHEFDHAYMGHMVQAHKQAISAFEREAKSGKDADARAWAEKTLPALREHLKMATEINAKLGKGMKK